MTTIATATLPESVQLPQYDRNQLRSRIVHFGFGAFHRAHQALLTDRVLNASGGDWGICEISLFSGDRLMSQLRQQDHRALQPADSDDGAGVGRRRQG